MGRFAYMFIVGQTDNKGVSTVTLQIELYLLDAWDHYMGESGDQQDIQDSRAPLRTERRWHVNSVHIRLQLLCSPVWTSEMDSVNVSILN